MLDDIEATRDEWVQRAKGRKGSTKGLGNTRPTLQYTETAAAPLSRSTSPVTPPRHLGRLSWRVGNKFRQQGIGGRKLHPGTAGGKIWVITCVCCILSSVISVYILSICHAFGCLLYAGYREKWRTGGYRRLKKEDIKVMMRFISPRCNVCICLISCFDLLFFHQ